MTKSNVIRDIVDERNRQITKEGWTEKHDDKHIYGELALAAATYAYISTYDRNDFKTNQLILTKNNFSYISPDFYTAYLNWPWDAKWLKPDTRRRDLIKAAALIVAEIERLDRQDN